METRASPWTHTGIVNNEFKTTCKGRDVTVPAGTHCYKLDDGAYPWIVSDLSFIEDKNSILYSDADIYGIRVPEEYLRDIMPSGQYGAQK